MPRIFEDAARENIRERLRRHHSAGERVKPAAARGRIVNRLSIENERRHFFEQLQARQQPARGEGAPIVNLGHLHAQPTDVDGKFAKQTFPPKFVDHAERLLRFAERKNRREDAAADAENAIDRFCESPLLGGPPESFRQRTVAPRRFNDQDVDA